MPLAFHAGISGATCTNSCTNTRYSDRPHDAATAATAIVWIAPREIHRPITRLISAPSSGNSGTHSSSGRPRNLSVEKSTLMPQGGEPIDVDIAAAAEYGDDDRETDACFGGGDGDHDQREGVRRDVAPHSRECQQRHVR